MRDAGNPSAPGWNVYPKEGDIAVQNLRLIVRRCCFAIFLATCLAGCSEPITHNEEMAAKRALEFAEVALVKQDLDAAYALLSNKAKSYVPVEKFKETIQRLHPNGYPLTVRTTGFKPMTDEKAIYIYLSADTADGQFHYALTLNGTAASDYKVSVVERTR
jgi:hypothetical protein